MKEKIIDGFEYLDPGNTFKIKHIWAVISEDEKGDEGICAAPLSGGGTLPLIGADPKRVKQFDEMIPLIKKGTDKKIKLVKFSIREDIKVY